MPTKADLITLQRILPPPFHATLRGAPAVAEAQEDRWIFERLYLLGATARGDGFEPIAARQKLSHLAELAQTAPSDALAWGRTRALAVSELHPADREDDTQYMTYMRLWRAVCVHLSDACLRVGNAIAEAIPNARFVADTHHDGDEELRWTGTVVRGESSLLWVDATLADAAVRGDDDAGCGLSIGTQYLSGVPGVTWIPYHYSDATYTEDPTELRRRLTYELDVASLADLAVRDYLARHPAKVCASP